MALSSFFHQAESRLAEEENRIEMYLHESTRKTVSIK